MPIASELNVNTAATAMDMANMIFGQGVTVTSATYTGDPLSSGTYTITVRDANGCTAQTTASVLVPTLLGDFGFEPIACFGGSTTVTLSATGLPNGVTAVFSPNPVPAGSSATLRGTCHGVRRSVTRAVSFDRIATRFTALVQSPRKRY